MDISNQDSSWDPAGAKWLGNSTPAQPTETGKQKPAPTFRKDTTLRDVEIKKATLRTAAYGLYVAYINGDRVGDQVLDPPPSDYKNTVIYSTFDVTKMVTPGQNTIGYILGRGFLGVGNETGTMVNLHYLGEPRVMAELDVQYIDGTTQLIVTDDSWLQKDSATLDSLMYGENHGIQDSIADWSKPSYKGSGWNNATIQQSPTKKLSPRVMPPTKIVNSIQPINYTYLSNNSGVYDFGKITAGWARITIKADKGTIVTLKFGEQLKPDGTVYIHNSSGSADQVNQDTYVVNGVENETWEPDFTRRGFRYIEVSFSTERSPDDFEIEARTVYSDLKKIGTFETSNDLINTLHTNQAYTMLLNFWGLPSDTPWRDRLPWLADASLYMDSAAHNFDIKDLYYQWLTAVRESQREDGSIGAVGPDYSGTVNQVPNDPSWPGQFIPMVWNHYQLYADRRILSENYSSMKLLISSLENTISNSGYLYTTPGFGDWSSPGTELNGTTAFFPPENDIPSMIASGGFLPLPSTNGDLYHEVNIMHEIAKELGNIDDANHYAELAEKIKNAFNEKFLDKENGLYRNMGTNVGYRQTTNLVALAYNMVPAEYKSAVFDNLVADITSRGNHLNTGSTGTKLILPVLSDNGAHELAYSLLTQTTYPSWGYWTTQNAETSWETWSNTGLEQSMSHAFLGTYQDWLYKYLAGIRSAAPGYKKITLKPIIPEALNYVTASLMTENGEIKSAWQKTNSELVWSITIPDGIETQIYIPKYKNGDVSFTESSSSLMLVGNDGDYSIYSAVGTGSEISIHIH